MDKDIINIGATEQRKSLFAALSEEAKKDIVSGLYGKSGERFLSVRAFAKSKGVTLVTAQKVFTELKNSGLIALSGNKYYVFCGVMDKNAALKKRGRTEKLIGVHIPNLESPYFASLARSVEKACRKRGYQTAIVSSGYDYKEEAAALEFFAHSGACGVISCPGRTKEIEQVYSRYVLPAVFVSNGINGLFNDGVAVDNNGAGEQVASFLYGLGYRNFMYVSPDVLKNAEDKRLIGFRRRLKELNCDFDENAVVYINNSGTSSPENAIGVEIYNRSRPLGVFCNTDLQAVEVVKACKKWKFNIATEVGIVGFDDLSIGSGYNYSLTTVHYPTGEMVEAAVDKLFRQLGGEKQSGNITKICPHLIIRSSTTKIDTSKTPSTQGASQR